MTRVKKSDKEKRAAKRRSNQQVRGTRRLNLENEFKNNPESLVREYTTVKRVEMAMSIANNNNNRNDISKRILGKVGNKALMDGRNLGRTFQLTTSKSIQGNFQIQDNTPNFSATRPQPQPQPKPHTAAQLRALQHIDEHLQFTPPILPRRRS